MSKPENPAPSSPVTLQVLTLPPVAAAVRSLTERFRSRAWLKWVECDAAAQVVHEARTDGARSLLILHAPTFEALAQYMPMLMPLRTVVEAGRARSILILGAALEKVELPPELDYFTELVSSGVSEKSMVFKIERHLRSLLADRGSGADAPAASVAGGPPSPLNPRRVFVAPAMSAASDCWILQGAVPRQLGGRWMLRMLGPGPLTGKWMPYENAGAASAVARAEELWKWAPSPVQGAGVDPFGLGARGVGFSRATSRVPSRGRRSRGALDLRRP